MQHFFPFLIFGFVILFNLLKAAKGAGIGGRPQAPGARPRMENDVERARRFREALGLPPNAVPPGPPLKRAPSNPAAPLFPVSPPPVLAPGQLRRSGQPGPLPPVLQGPPPAPVLPRPAGPVAPPPPAPAPAPARPVQPIGTAVRPAAFAGVASAYRQDAGQTAVQRANGTSARSQGILALLRVHGTARNAVILREVLGPPKALA